MEKQKFEIESEHPASYPSGGREPQFQYLYYRWNEIKAGDCHQINGVLMFRSDGNGTFDATVWTDHTSSGDVWHSSFSVSDDDGIFLFGLGEFNSPTTWGAHVQMHAQFTFPADKFPRLPKRRGIIQNSAC